MRYWKRQLVACPCGSTVPFTFAVWYETSEASSIVTVGATALASETPRTRVNSNAEMATMAFAWRLT